MIQKIKQCFNNIKYRSKLILLCILVSFLPLSVMGFFCYNQTINLLRTRELDSLESSILSVSNSLDSKVNTYQNLLAYLANSNVLAEFSSYNEANAYDQYEYLNYTMDKYHIPAAPRNFSDHNLQCRWRYDTRQTTSSNQRFGK